MQEAKLAFDIGLIPFEILLGGSLEQDEHAGRVGAVAIDHPGRIDAVVLRLRHLFKEGLERFTRDRIAGIVGIGHIGGGDVFATGRIFVGDGLHHPLGEQAFKRFIEAEQTAIPQHLGEEAGIEQMQDGVLNAAHVLVHRQPAIDSFAAKGQLDVAGVTEAQEIPAGTHEGVHGVGLAPGRFAAAGTRHLHPGIELGQGRSALAAEGHIPGQLHR